MIIHLDSIPLLFVGDYLYTNYNYIICIRFFDIFKKELVK
nr:MAG TPA: hypothetical protein [Caudoviricetes sp.]